MIVVKAEEHKKVLKLVSDRFAEKGKIVLREDDMESLDLEAGDEVDIIPYTTMRSEIKEKWESFKERFKKEEDEEKEEDS
jgi:4-hydroxy-3-methylbut-2-enyl diphosphate reductase IspH